MSYKYKYFLVAKRDKDKNYFINNLQYNSLKKQINLSMQQRDRKTKINNK